MVMNRRHLLSGAVAAAALRAAAQDTTGPVPLFDGKTLAGWTIEEGPETAFHVSDRAIVVHESAGFPAWLRSARQYENFDFRCEFFIQGWIDSGIYIHAPEHGRNTWEGVQVKIFQQADEKPASNSMGSLFPLVAPRLVNVRSQGEWNTMRIRMDWPRLQVWTNGEQIQDFDLERDPLFRYRLRKGYLGLSSLSYPIRFRNLTIEELPPKEKWDVLFDGPASMDRWYVTDGKPRFEAVGRVLRGDGTGYLATKEMFRDFELRMYARGMREHNSGVLFRTDGHGSNSRHYEIQLHDVEDAHYPTGSLYHFKRGDYPRIEHERWFPLHLIVEGRRCIVRINGDTVCEYGEMTNLEEGHIELQAHRAGYWTEFKDIRIKRL
jgi:Domain of Unknown Function (DUF1080)